MPEPAAPSKPQSPPRRFWLFAPYVAALVLAVGGGLAWFAMKGELERRLDLAAEGLRARGYEVSWTARRIYGFPFRLDVELDQPRIVQPSGWAIAAPQLRGEAYSYDPGRWILFAPLGLSVARPGKGAVDVTGRAIRASASGLEGPHPRLSFQGLDLTFKPQPGALPATLQSAQALEIHVQPGPDDQAALMLRVTGGTLAAADPLAGLARGRPLALTWDSRLSHVSRLSARDWPSAVRGWTLAGGAMTVVQAQLSLGETMLEAKPATLTVGDDGRMQGELPLGLRGGPGDMTLSLRDGIATLGPIRLGPSLRIY